MAQMEEAAIASRLDFSKSLNQGANAEVLRTQIESLLCPSASVVERMDHGVNDRALITYMGCASGTVTRETSPDHPLYQTSQNGMLYRDSQTRLAHVFDGTAHTVLIGESLVAPIAVGRDNTGIPQLIDHWAIASPTLARNEVSEAIGSTGVKINIAMAQHQSFYPDEHELSFSSHHSAGVQFVFADGHVQLLNAQIDPEIYHALGTRAGKETATNKGY